MMDALSVIGIIIFIFAIAVMFCTDEEDPNDNYYHRL